ncbi:MAG: hypothetical protein AAF039_07220 [Bacteroidota bacterium]
MKALQFIRAPILLLFPWIFLACSDDDVEPGCFQDEGRRIIATINDIRGTIDSCISINTIDPDVSIESSPINLFAPCNLSPEFQVEGSRVVFSGHIYESFDTEDICADFFEITDIRFIE